MSTQDERQDLMQNPIPLDLKPLQSVAIIDYVTNCPADRVLTSIVLIDEQVGKIQEALAPYLKNLGEQRERLVARAVSENITEDVEAVLVEKTGKVFRNEIDDLKGFKNTFPTEYEQIRADQRKALNDKYENNLAAVDESKIPLGLADGKVGKDRVTAFVGYRPQVITYEVVRKGRG